MTEVREKGLPIEEFIQALTSQLDRAQATMGVKAKLGMPLTFAVKEISVDLRAHVDMVGSEIVIRPVAPSDQQASVLHFQLTTITRPVIEENTFQIESEGPSLKEFLGDDLTDEEQKRFQWAGIHNVAQLRQLQQQSGEGVLEQIVQIPANRLRSALRRASEPRIHRIAKVGSGAVKIKGANLRKDIHPTVRLDGRHLRVLSATDDEVVIEQGTGVLSGVLSLETGPGHQDTINLSAAEADADTVTVNRSHRREEGHEL